MSAPGLTRDEVDHILEIVQREACIVLEAANQYLLATRLGDAARRCGQGSPSELVKKARLFPGGNEYRAIIDALTTNETYFLRDPRAWEALRSGPLAALVERRRPQRKLYVWSAASSTGQEACSVVMGLREWFRETDSWDVQVHGSDVSSAAIARAELGKYEQLEVSRGLPADWLKRHFEQQGHGFQLRSDLRRRLKFHRMNLAGRWAALPTFDLVLLRNVLIYFEGVERRKVLERIARQMAPDGLLMLSPQERSHPTAGLFELVDAGSAVYRRV
ncbi:MAG: protein-glutamate O-methyltransferase CheR [Planctomycetota bacterium]